MTNPQPKQRPTIGVLAGWQFYNTATSLNYLMPVYKGIENAAREQDCNLLLGCGIGSGAELPEPSRPAWFSDSDDNDFVPIGPWNTDGLIIFTPLHSPERSAALQSLIRDGFPVLFIGSGEQGPTLAADNASGVREAINHLVNHGHREIAFIAGSLDDLAGDTGERLQAYLAALDALGLPFDSRRVAYGNHVFNGGFTAMQQILDTGVGFTAVLASNDESALGAIRALKEVGREIPRDVAVIGFDNRLEDTVQKPSLSSVHIPLQNMGRIAFESLLARIRHQASLPDIMRVETRLITRESCGCAANSGSRGWHDGTVFRPEGQIDEITAAVLYQARNLNTNECRKLCQDLRNSFFTGVQHGDPNIFITTLLETLRQTTLRDDDAFIWHDAVSMIYADFQKKPDLSSSAAQLAASFLDQARITISSFMQHHHSQYLSQLAWVTNQLSLLTAALLNALDEQQIFRVLATHLPAVGIQQAHIALYESDQDNPTAWSVIRNIFDVPQPEKPLIRIRSREFPPAELISEEHPYYLTLIPFARSDEQIGYVVFDCQHIDLYGAIVQQIGGALNSARLYREATEGRKLAEEANRLKNRLLSVIGHELRTPLNLIVGLSEFVLKSAEESPVLLPEVTQKDIEHIYAYSQHLAGLVGDVFDLATSDAGQLRLSNDFVDLGQTLQLVCESGKQMAMDKGLAWEADIPESGPWVWGDRMRLRQVALNLINNAIKYTDQGSVTFRLTVNADNSVTVLVSDTGLGILQEDQQVIFNEFRQSDKSVMLGYGGLGLGLAISKRLVELHGGTIGVQSSGKTGAGSTFYFNLPTVPAPGEYAHKIDLPAGVSSVLVLTSNPEGIQLLTDRLTQRGIQAQIKTLCDPLELPSMLFYPVPDAILIDVSDEACLGLGAVNLLRAIPLARDLPILLFKSSREMGTLFELNYLTKPVEPGELSKFFDQQLTSLSNRRPTRNVLIVEDDFNTLEMNARIVQSHSLGNHVLKAQNGHDAIKILSQETVDLILLDLHMPQMDGFAVLEYLRDHEELRKIPVVVVTGVELTTSEIERLNRGVITILEKGLYSLDESVDRINTALERKRRLSSEAQRLVRKAMAYIHENYAKNISRHDIAHYINVSDDHLTFCFRQELNVTPIEYLQRYRVRQARQLLKDSDRSISEIALDVGFTDSGYFSRIFRRIIGMSPENFRRSL